MLYLAMSRPGYEADRRRIILRDWSKGADGADRVIAAEWDRSPDEIRLLREGPLDPNETLRVFRDYDSQPVSLTDGVSDEGAAALVVRQIDAFRGAGLEVDQAARAVRATASSSFTCSACSGRDSR